MRFSLVAAVPSRILAVGMIAILGIGGIFVIATQSRTTKNLGDEPAEVSIEEGVQTIRTAQGETYQVLSAARAQSRLMELESTHKKFGFRRAVRNLQKRGIVPTVDVTVVRKLPTGEVRSGEAMTASQSVSTGAGEVLFWTWDDGDDNTWEGVVYVERYSDGMYVTWDMQLDISSPTTIDSGDWTELDDFGDVDEGEGEGDPEEVAFERKLDHRRRDIAIPIVWTGAKAMLLQCPSYGCAQWQRLLAWQNATAASLRARARAYARCLMPVGGTAILYCWASGPGFVACSVTRVGIFGIVGCGLHQLAEHIFDNDP